MAGGFSDDASDESSSNGSSSDESCSTEDADQDGQSPKKFTSALVSCFAILAVVVVIMMWDFRRSSNDSDDDEDNICVIRDPEMMIQMILDNSSNVFFDNTIPTNDETTFVSSYVPGELSVRDDVLGLLLSTGLHATLVAKSGEFVNYTSHLSLVESSSTNFNMRRRNLLHQSAERFHIYPDAGATFVDVRAVTRTSSNTSGSTDDDGNDKSGGGWIYVSNSEVGHPVGGGGVGAVTFDRDGQVMDYRMVLPLGVTNWNCGGGKTPWNTWISCEEYNRGGVWQVDPTGQRPAQRITLGSSNGGGPGRFESFAFHVRTISSNDTSVERQYFVTEDDEFGPLRRFRPYSNNTNTSNLQGDPWQELHGEGETTYLRLIPTVGGGNDTGVYEWITDKEVANLNANAYYPNAEGIDVDGDQLYFISKRQHVLFILDLGGEEGGTILSYKRHTTRSGVFDGQPDQMQRILGDNDDLNLEVVDENGDTDELLYFTEDGGAFSGVHARNRQGQFLTILEGYDKCSNDETTGLAFSPNGMHMYVAFQKKGYLLDITRVDGLPFYAKSLNIKYHATGDASSESNSSRSRTRRKKRRAP